LPPPDAALQAHSLAVATRVVLKRCLTHHALSNYVLSKFLERFVARLVVRQLMEYPSLADPSRLASLRGLISTGSLGHSTENAVPRVLSDNLPALLSICFSSCVA